MKGTVGKMVQEGKVIYWDWELHKLCKNPTGPFAILELQNLSSNEMYVIRNRRSTDGVVVNLRKDRPQRSGPVSLAECFAIFKALKSVSGRI